MSSSKPILPRCITEEMLDLVEKAGWRLRFVGGVYVLSSVLGILVAVVIFLRAGIAAALEAGSQLLVAFLTLVVGLVLRHHGWIARRALQDRTILSMHRALEAQRNLLVIAGVLILLFVGLIALAIAVATFS